MLTTAETTGDAVVLPGYEAGIDRSGVEHSQRKLGESSDRLFETLAAIEKERGPGHEASVVPSVRTLGCSSEAETWTYRCRCNFQIVRVEADSVGEPGTAIVATSPTNPFSYRYAMRSGGRPVLLGTKNSFPIATRRIQTAMNGFMQCLNDADGESGDSVLGTHLTSCTFSSAWRDTPRTDCILTLHYDHPLEDKKTLWRQRANEVCRKLELRQLNGRSRGTLVSVRGDDTSAIDDANGDEAEATIRDTVYLQQSHRAKEGNDASNEPDDELEWSVSLEEQQDSSPFVRLVIPVDYHKPETAFYHPNPNAMTKALAWMLNRLQCLSSSSERPLRLLEMYCGCGAHTVALGRSGLVAAVHAVELDPRLVRACEANVASNGLEGVVEVRRGDAGKWARDESRRRKKKQTDGQHFHGYDVLLVDPPRQGLDEAVCNMAMVDGSSGCFRNILYVSCGHMALLRDLRRLSPCYELVDCAQMDLFPRTDSIETLVHLRRRG